MSKLDREDRRVKFRAGARTIVLRPIPQTLLADVISEDGKPTPPTKQVQYMGGVMREEPDENDAAYQQKLRLWQATYNARMLRVCITFGVDKIEGPEPDIQVMSQLEAAYGKQSGAELMMRYVMYLIGDNTTGFLNLALAQTMPTQEGLADSQSRFPDTDGGPGDTRVDQSLSHRRPAVEDGNSA